MAEKKKKRLTYGQLLLIILALAVLAGLYALLGPVRFDHYFPVKDYAAFAAGVEALGNAVYPYENLIGEGEAHELHRAGITRFSEPDGYRVAREENGRVFTVVCRPYAGETVEEDTTIHETSVDIWEENMTAGYAFTREGWYYLVSATYGAADAESQETLDSLERVIWNNAHEIIRIYDERAGAEHDALHQD